MKRLAFIIYLVQYTAVLFSQNMTGSIGKPPVDTTVFAKWSSIGEFKISNNGKYALYTINNQPVHSQTLVIQALNDNWKRELPGAASASFTDDNHKVLFTGGNNTLCLLDLEDNNIENIPHVLSFKLFKQKDGEWLACHLNFPDKQLILRNMKTDRKLVFDEVSSFQLHKRGNSMLLKREKSGSDALSTVLTWVELPSGREKDIWRGRNADNLVFDDSGTQLAFISSSGQADTKENSLWIYKAGANKATVIADNQSHAFESGFRLSAIDHFSKDGMLLFFKVDAPDFPKLAPDAVMVDVWSYTDPKLQPQQLKELASGSGSYLYAVNIKDRKISRLQGENETITLYNSQLGDLAFISYNQGLFEKFWNTACQPSYYISFINSGHRRRVNLRLVADEHIAMSPNGRYLLMSDEGERDIYSYDIQTGIEQNLTGNLPIPLDYDGKEKGVLQRYKYQYRKLKVAAWLAESAGVLIYDQYDIWQIDPSGKRPTKCLTDGYGLVNKIVFRLVEEPGVFAENLNDYIIQPGSKVLLTAFDTKNAYNGFYRITAGRQAKPEKLMMDANVYFVSGVDPEGGEKPVKAANADIWLVRKENASQSPNLLFTRDFKDFTPLSHLYPEKDYNWMTSEMVTFKTLDGQYERGVLYKPENFDSSRKYPIIFHYYEELSQRANTYHRPEAINDNLNIPWFVSHGYIIFTPDIHYRYGYTGENALNTVVGAAKHMMMFPWIDSSRMGLQGHSFGGYETNYIITHTNMFAAAMSSSGVADLISGYNSLAGGAINGTASYQSFYESGQYRLGCSLWENAEVYIRNSPIFYADKVTTPLLMMNNKLDGSVDFSQGIEFFTALRRLGKRVWMLQYDGESHSIFNERVTKLHTILMTQFFDHYLKQTPAPMWMTRGIPASMKGINHGLEPDMEIQTPGKGLKKEEN